MKKLYFTGMLLLLCSICRAQDSSAFPPIKWIVAPGMGVDLGLSSFPGGYITDNLISQQRTNVYVKVFSGAHFFNRWGVEANLSLGIPGSTTPSENRFRSAISAKYGDAYYVTPKFIPEPDQPMVKAGIGPAYKFEKGRVILITRLMIGLNTLATANTSANLKGKGTNEYLNVYWQTKKSSQDNLTYSPSVTLAYRLTRRLALTFDINYLLYRTDFTYRESTEDTGAGVETIKDYRYKKTLSQLSVGVGLMIVIK